MQPQPQSKELPQYERILFATDGSSTAQEAGRHAVFLAQRAQAQLIVLHVIPNSITRRLSFLLGLVQGEERRVSRQAIDELVRLAEASGVQVLAVEECGHRTEAIDRAASKFDVDLIVMGSCGGDDLERIFGQPGSGKPPMWATRPVCVIMC